MRYSLLCGCLLILSACASAPVTDRDAPVAAEPESEQLTEQQPLYLPEPLPADHSIELDVARVTELLRREELEQEQQAVLYYRRGILYDALGLATLALLDMNNALEKQPDMAEAYHYMGLYYTRQEEFSAAFEAFDSVIELDPDHEYVYLNRGLASYYGGQYELALSDFADYRFQEPDDAFRSLWFFFANYQLDPGRAWEQLHEAEAELPADSWGRSIVGHLTGQVAASELIDQVFTNAGNQRELNEMLCEAYFYMGKKAALEERQQDAVNYFKLSLMTQVHEYLEHQFARLELQRTREQLDNGQ